MCLSSYYAAKKRLSLSCTVELNVLYGTGCNKAISPGRLATSCWRTRPSVPSSLPILRSGSILSAASQHVGNTPSDKYPIQLSTTWRGQNLCLLKYMACSHLCISICCCLCTFNAITTVAVILHICSCWVRFLILRQTVVSECSK